MSSVQVSRSVLSEKQWLGLAVLLALVLRLAFAFGYWVDKPLTVDQIEYLMLADNLRQGEGLTYDEPHRLMRSPGYPVFLAAVLTAHPETAGVKAVQALLGAISVLLVAALARRLGGARTGVVAAFLMACYPPQIFQPGYILSETLFTALALATLLLCWRVLDAARDDAATSNVLRSTAVAGIGLGLTILTRPEALLFAGMFSLYVVVSQRALAAGVTLVVVAGATVAPWPLYNVLIHDRVIMLSSRGGPNLWMGNNEHAVGDGDVSGNSAMETAYESLLRSDPQLSPEQVERVFYAETFRYIGDEPLHFLGNTVRKAFYFWVPVGKSYQHRSARYWAMQALSFIALLALAGRALPTFLRVKPFPVVLVALLASVFVTCLIFFPLARYRVPVFDPVLIAIAALSYQGGSRRRALRVSRELF